MTCIVGLVHEGAVYIGGDSAGGGEIDIDVYRSPKIFIRNTPVQNEPMAFGFTTSWRMGQLIQYKMEIPARNNKDILEYLVVDFVDALWKCLIDGGFARKDNNVETGGNFLVGMNGRLFDIHSNFQVLETVCGYDACGCGDDFAKGALWGTQGMNSPALRVRAALTAAEFHSAFVTRPFHIVSIPAVLNEKR